MDQLARGQRSPAHDILRVIQRRGPQSIKSLEAELGVTTNAIREQIQYLLAEGLIMSDKLRGGAGRPAHVYSLSEKGQGLFPQSYDLLLKLLLEEIARADGADRAQQLLNAVGARLAEDVVGGERSVTLTQQLEHVSSALDQRGIPIAIFEGADGVALQEWSCPFYSLAREMPGVCEMEQHMLEHALGARVTIAERMIDGHAGCKFMIERDNTEQNALSEVSRA
jgi:DeoR family transcriptional regulator, suf operon transcriptional repressor